jgi:hypothetical protein
LNTRSTWRFNALMTPMRANIVGPEFLAGERVYGHGPSAAKRNPQR